MSDPTDEIAAILTDAAETHHQVYRIVDGTDPDWASWYSDWLIHLSALPDLLGAAPVRSELTWLLVELDKRHTAHASPQPWPTFYAAGLWEHFRQQRT